MPMQLRIALLAPMLFAAPYVAADKVIHEPYPWPNAEYPSREKPMRRDLSEPLEFGEKYPKPESAKPASKPVKKAKKPSKTAKKPSVSRSKPVEKPVASRSKPVKKSIWDRFTPSQRIAPTRPDALPPGYPLPEKGEAKGEAKPQKSGGLLFRILFVLGAGLLLFGASRLYTRLTS